MKTKTIKGWVVLNGDGSVPLGDRFVPFCFTKAEAEEWVSYRYQSVGRATLTVEVPDGA